MLVIGATTGVIEMTVPEIRVDLQPVDKVEKGTVFSMPSKTLLRRGDKLYKWEKIEEDPL